MSSPRPRSACWIFSPARSRPRDHPWSRQAIGIARGIENGATIIGTSRLSTPGDAAFANATLGHGLVREDMHAASICHHGVVIWPTLLALVGTNAARPARHCSRLRSSAMRPARRSAAHFYRRSGAALSADRPCRAAGRSTGGKPCARSQRRCRDECGFHCRQHIVRPERMAACRRLRDVLPSGFCGPQRDCGDRTGGSRRLRLGKRSLKVRPDCSPLTAGSLHPPTSGCLPAASRKSWPSTTSRFPPATSRKPPRRRHCGPRANSDIRTTSRHVDPRPRGGGALSRLRFQGPYRNALQVR